MSLGQNCNCRRSLSLRRDLYFILSIFLVIDRYRSRDDNSGDPSVLFSVTKCFVARDACLLVIALYSGRRLWDGEERREERIWALEPDTKSHYQKNGREVLFRSSLSFAILLRATLMRSPRQMKSLSRASRDSCRL